MEQAPFFEQREKRQAGRQEGRQAPEPERNQGEPGNHDGTDFFFLSKGRRDKKGDKKGEEGRQVPEPERNQEEPGNHVGTDFFFLSKGRRDKKGDKKGDKRGNQEGPHQEIMM